MPNLSGNSLRQLLEGDTGIVTCPGIYDGVSAVLAEQQGFLAGYLTGGGTSAGAFGLPDLGLVTMTEMVDQLHRIRSCVEFPIIMDMDTGFGNELNVTRTIRQYERAGASALHLEDQAFPKRCGHLPGKELLPIDEYLPKLSAALNGRESSETMIIARTDSRGVEGLESAIQRAIRYHQEGADMIFVEAPRSYGEFAEIAERVPGRLMANMIANSHSPSLGTQALETLGYSLVIFPLVALGPAISAIRDSLAALRETATDELEGGNLSPQDVFRVVGLDDWLQLAGVGKLLKGD